MSRYDAIVIGAGHNGLTTAALMAKRGRKVLVIERREVAGGIASGDAFHLGYRSAGLLHDTTGVRRSVVESLGLERHGLKLAAHRPDVLALADDGSGFVLHGDAARAAAAIGAFSARDGECYLGYRALLDRLRQALQPVVDAGPFDPIDLRANSLAELARAGLAVRRLGKKDMLELLRLPPMCVADWLNEWFESDTLKAALALPAIAGTFTGPWSPGSNANLLLGEITAGPGVAGEGVGLAEALEAAARAHGVEFRTGCTVRSIALDANRACGVVLEGGERIEAKIVASACDPKHTLLELLPRGALSVRLEERIRNLRARGTTAQVLLALRSPLSFAARPDDLIEFARTGGSLDQLERAFDAVKYRRFSARPALEIHVPTVSRPDLAPSGGSVVSMLVHFAPYDLEGGWTAAAREQLGDTVLGILERLAPGVTATVVRREVLAPVDLETRYGLSGGHVHHGEHSIDQLLVRPAPECLRYATPIAGLYLCGSGSYPGGGLTCAPGALAAETILAS